MHELIVTNFLFAYSRMYLLCIRG